MTKPKKINTRPVANSVLLFDSGLNESVSSIEMGSGDLISCKNYYLTDGSTGGYVSLPGYERYDGNTAPSSVGVVDEEDTAREAARTAIDDVPGIGSVLGCHIYKGKVYAFRTKIGGLVAGMFVESATGWVEVDTSANPLVADGKYTFINYNFLGTSGNEVMIWSDGKDHARSYNGSAVSLITNVGMGADDKPIFLTVHQSRLFLSYLGGSLQYSNVGDPNDWGAGSGELGIGDEITALKVTVGGVLVIFCRTKIKTLEGTDPATDWVLRDFSNSVGAFPYTVCEIFDTLIFMSDSGVTTLSAVQEFGNFRSASISEKVKKSLLKDKSKVKCATVFRQLNQYRLYFDNSKFLIFSFLNKKLRGITSCQYNTPVYTVAEGQDTNGNPIVFFTSNTARVYHSDIGTSFDGAIIDTKMSTSYFHFKSPRTLKRFLRATFEIISTDSIVIYVKPSFDYSITGYSKSLEEDIDILGAGSIWGEGEWGEMMYVSSEVTNRVFHDMFGIGANMSISLRSSNKHLNQHTIQNAIIDYIVMGRQA